MTTYKTPFSKRCDILGDLWLNFSDQDKDPSWQQYFEVYDIGLPLAYFVSEGIATIKKGNENLINDAWDTLCQMVGVSGNDVWNDLGELFDASPNARPVDSE